MNVVQISLIQDFKAALCNFFNLS